MCNTFRIVIVDDAKADIYKIKKHLESEGFSSKSFIAGLREMFTKLQTPPLGLIQRDEYTIGNNIGYIKVLDRQYVVVIYKDVINCEILIAHVYDGATIKES